MVSAGSVSSATAVPPYVCLRPVVAQDARALHRGCYPELAYDEFGRRFGRSLQRQGHGRAVQLIAEDMRPALPEIIGTAHLWRYVNVSELADVLVAEAWRGQGIGTALIMTLTTHAAVSGWMPLEIGVEADNAGALRLYQRLGFAFDRELRLAAGKTAYMLRMEAFAATEPPT